MGSKRIYNDDDSGTNPEASPEIAPPPGVAESAEAEGKTAADRLLDELRAETAPEIAEGLLDKLENETNERKRIELLQSMLTDQDVETLESNLAVLKENPEVLDEQKIAALSFLTDELLYVLPRVMLEKPDLDPMNLEAVWMGIYLLKDPDTKKRDARVVPLVKTLKYLHGQRGVKWVKAYLEKAYPKLAEQAKKLAGPTSEAVDEVRRVNDGKEGDKTKMREWMESNPYLTTAGLAIGAYAGARILHWMYKKLRKRQQEREAAGKKVHGKKFFGFVDKITGFFDKLAKPALIASLAVITAGSILGIEEVEKYLKKNGHEGLYQNKAIAGLVELLRGHPDEAVATFIHGPRSANEKVRQSSYAKYFGVDDKQVWVLGPVKFKDFVDSDPGRSTSLVSSRFSGIPIIGKLFESEEQVEAEKKIRDYFTDADIQKIRANLEGADDKTMNEVLQVAFYELFLFDATATPAEDTAAKKRAEDGEQTPREQLAGQLDAEVAAMAEKTKGLDNKDVLLEDDLETLRTLNEKVNGELLELQSTLPTYMSDMKEVIVKTFHSVISEGEIEQGDMVAAKAQYDAVFDEFEEDEKTAIVADLDALEEGRKFFADEVKAGELLTDDQKDKLKLHVAKMNQVHRRIREAIKQIKKVREDEIALDVAEGFTDTDMLEGVQIWWTGYTSAFFGLSVDIQTLVDEDTGKVSKACALGALTAKGLLLEEGARGLMMAFTGRSGVLLGGKVTGLNRIIGAATVICPPVRIGLKTTPTFFLDVAEGLRYSPKAVFEQFFKGQMGRKDAQMAAEAGLNFRQKYWGWREKIPYLRTRHATQMRNWQSLVTSFEDLSVTQLEKLLTMPIGEVTDYDKFTQHFGGETSGFKSLRNAVRDHLGMEWDEFVRYARRLHLESGGQLMKKTPTLRHITFSRFARFSSAIAEKLGVNRIPTDKLRGMFPGVRQFLAENAGRTLSYSTLLLAAYWTCHTLYYDREKGAAVILTASTTLGGVGAMELAGAAGTLVAAPGSIYTAERAAALGLQVGARAPGPVWAKGLYFLAVFVAGIVGFKLSETAAGKLLRQRAGLGGTVASFARGSLAPALHSLSDGALLDYYDFLHNDDVKRHFMLETYFLDSHRYYKAKPAFGFHRDSKSIEAGISMWNGKINEKIAEAEADADNSEIRELKMQLIDENWVDRQIAEYAAKKDRTSGTGEELYAAITDYMPDLTAKQNALCKSMLVDDVADTWIEDEYRIAEDDERFALVKSLAKRIDEQKGTALEDKLGAFVTYKKDLQYDKKFYGVIGMTERVVNADEEEVERVMSKDNVLMAMLGLTEDELNAAQEVIDEMDAEGGMDEFEVLDEAA